MRVLMVSDVYFPRINGVSTAIQTYHQSLQENGIEAYRAATEARLDDAAEADSGAE